ncbi:hypothetical protein EJB05_00406, partial [Eragrostis curvula]
MLYLSSCKKTEPSKMSPTENSPNSLVSSRIHPPLALLGSSCRLQLITGTSSTDPAIYRMASLFDYILLVATDILNPKNRESEQSNGLLPTVPEEELKEPDYIPIAGNIKIYSLKELRKATRNFCPGNKLGQGSFGCVYLGKLKNGEKVAIKVLSSESRQGMKEFLNELGVISNVTHPNLVKLLGCCADGGQKMLVYNFIENNSLAQILFGNSHSGIRLDWRTRVKICIGIAEGLAYLHEEVRPPIVHRDIKASNILLDRNLNPKIADFGLAKLFPGNMTHISTRVAGTLGYLAPEYAIRGQLTKKADVYSFGVLLLEIVSGRCHTDPTLPLEDQYLLEKVWMLYESGDLESIIDKTLQRDFDAEEAHRLLKIGLLCTQDATKIRPSMSTIAKMLKYECAVGDKIMRPGLITDVMDLKVRAVEPIQLSPSMSPSVDNSQVSTLALAGSTLVENP